MKKRIITLGGLPGSGKTTIRKMLAEQLGYKTFSTGEFVRNMAAENKVSLEEFNRHMVEDRSIDIFIDEKLKGLNESDEAYIVDAHLAFHFIPNGFSAYLKISPEKAAERIFKDAHSAARIRSGEVMETLDAAKKHTDWRIQNNIERYEKLYGINPYDESQYDFCVDSENKEADKVASIIIEAYQKWLEG